jgi:hypothetical protein
MSKAEEYRQHAQQCVDAAQRIQNAEEPAILLQMAQRWMLLAKKEQNAPSSSESAQQQQQVQPTMTRKSTPLGRMTPDKQHHRSERLQVMLTPDEIAAIEDFWFQARIPSRSAAVRELLRRGLIASGELKRGLKPRKGTPD